MIHIYIYIYYIIYNVKNTSINTHAYMYPIWGGLRSPKLALKKTTGDAHKKQPNSKKTTGKISKKNNGEELKKIKNGGTVNLKTGPTSKP